MNFRDRKSEFGEILPSLASNSFTSWRLQSTRATLLRSGYEHSRFVSTHLPHFGLFRSHFNFRRRQVMQDMVAGGDIVPERIPATVCCLVGAEYLS